MILTCLLISDFAIIYYYVFFVLTVARCIFFKMLAYKCSEIPY